ncbi:MAG: saccharopine dehydrogenase NADP-binding domain-containing protein [Bdellovibrionota bacterium]
MPEFDIAVFGATGFTGRLAAQSLAQNPDLKILLAGRDRAKLEAVRSSCQYKPGIRVVDAMDKDAVKALVKDVKVIANFAGPFSKYAHAIVESVVKQGRAYCDITGETVFIGEMIAKFQEEALSTGAVLIPMAGFDSVPADITSFLALESAREHSWVIDRMDHYYKARGGFNGGTLETALAMQESGDALKFMDDNILIPDPSWPSPLPAPHKPQYEPFLKTWSAPFFMHNTNARVVRRARYLENHQDKDAAKAVYQEHMVIGKGPLGHLAANIMNAGLSVGAALSTKPLGRKLIRAVGPSPGEGPSQLAQEGGFFSGTLLAREGDKVRVAVRMKSKGDPGNVFTILCITEIAKLLLKEKPATRGFTTGSLAFGHKLMDKLKARGVKITSEIFP